VESYEILSAAGAYLICHLPMAVFHESYLPLMTELVGAQGLSDRQEELYELLATTLAAKVAAGLFLRSFLSLSLFRGLILSFAI